GVQKARVREHRVAQLPHQDAAAVPARRDQPAEHGRARGILVEVHGLRVVLGGKGDDLGAGDQPRPAVDDLAWREIFPMEAGHGAAYICPRWRIAPRCSLIRNMIRTNSEMMRAKTTPITTPIRLMMIQNKPPS